MFLASFFLRRIGLEFSYPLLTHPDESAILEPVHQMTINKTLNPGNFNRPDQILYIVNFVYLNVVSYLNFGKSIASTFLDNQYFFYFSGRLLICLLGSFVPIVAYKIGKEFKPDFAKFAAVVFAFFPSFVIHSHYITPDIPITLFSLLIILFTIKYVKTSNWNFLIFAGIFAAINTAEKYPGFLSLSIIFLGIVIQAFPVNPKNVPVFFTKIIQGIFRLLLVYLLSLYIVAPNIFIQFGSVITALKNEARTTHLGADNLGWYGNLLFYANSFSSFSNILGLIFGIFGTFSLVKSKERAAPLLVYGLFYWLILSGLALHWERWALPMYITPSLLIARGISYSLNFTNRKVFRIPIVLFILSFFVHQILFAGSVSISLTQPDTRNIALKYCDENGITPENSAFEGYTPFLPQYPKFIFDFKEGKNPSIDYFILSSHMYSRFVNESKRYKQEIDYYNDIRGRNELLLEIKPVNVNHSNPIDAFINIIQSVQENKGMKSAELFTGPIIQIYKVKK